MVVLENKNLRVEIAEKGAEIRRVTYCKEEKFWNGDPKYWTGVSPVLFPICSGLPDDKFTFEGKEYILEKHGFLKGMNSFVESKTQTSATFLFTETEETLKHYPWRFEVRVVYTLVDDSINVDYCVKNTSQKNMYFSIGAHEAYLCNEGIEQYDIIFEKQETLYAYELEGSLLSNRKNLIIENSKVLRLEKKYFEIDALIFKDIKSRYATLKNRETGKSVSVEFGGFDYLLIWHKVGAPYICIEPWAGITSTVGADYDITKKEGIIKLEPNKEKTLTHTIYF